MDGGSIWGRGWRCAVRAIEQASNQSSNTELQSLALAGTCITIVISPIGQYYVSDSQVCRINTPHATRISALLSSAAFWLITVSGSYSHTGA